MLRSLRGSTIFYCIYTLSNAVIIYRVLKSQRKSKVRYLNVARSIHACEYAVNNIGVLINDLSIMKPKLAES